MKGADRNRGVREKKKGGREALPLKCKSEHMIETIMWVGVG